MEPLVIKQKNQGLIIYFNFLEDWDAFELIANNLESKFRATITSKIDGPDSRIWKLSIENAHFTLRNDPYGNSLTSDSKEADVKLQEIYNNWSSIVL